MHKKLHPARILRRILNGDATSHTHLPQTVADLEALARARNNRCTCDTCTPRARKKSNCVPWPHFTPDLPSRLTTNRHGNTVFAPPKLSSRAARPAQGPLLARSMISYFDQPPSHLNDAQLAARASLIAWRDRRMSALLTPYAHPNGRLLVPAPEMQSLWEGLNTLFFGGRIPGIRFRWTEDKHGVLGRSAFSFGGSPVISMHPTRTSRDFGDYAVLDFLSTLVHEAVHAFLQFYACRWYHVWDGEYTAGGHGRVFQMLAKKLEEAVPRLLGVPVRLGRFESLLGDLGVREGKEGRLRGRVPSVHDLELWRFEDVDRDVQNADVRRLVEKTLAEWEG
ncbi:hypothetical protein P171DRAFT_503135, partial [Karstenula rhodostoma CBS 690.94]